MSLELGFLRFWLSRLSFDCRGRTALHRPSMKTDAQRRKHEVRDATNNRGTAAPKTSSNAPVRIPVYTATRNQTRLISAATCSSDRSTPVCPTRHPTPSRTQVCDVMHAGAGRPRLTTYRIDCGCGVSIMVSGFVPAGHHCGAISRDVRVSSIEIVDADIPRVTRVAASRNGRIRVMVRHDAPSRERVVKTKDRRAITSRPAH